MTVKCAIIEDDSISRTMIKALVEKTKSLELIGSFASALEAIPWLNTNEVDLLFLDVEMPEVTGLEMLRSLPHKPEVIVISANPEYAVEAFDLAVTDYLVKPVKDYARFLTAVNKVIAKGAHARKEEKEGKSFFVKVDSLLLKLDVDTILWIEAFGDYVRIQTTEKLHTVYSTLKNVEEKLNDKKFIRVHRSYIVNISRISNINPNNLEISSKVIPISTTYRDELLNRINVL